MNAMNPRIAKLLNDIESSSRRIIERLDGEDQETFTDIDSLDIQDIVWNTAKMALPQLLAAVTPLLADSENVDI